MVKKSALSKKLASYSALATAVLAINHEADAQISYTDLNPPIVIPNPIQFYSNYDTSAYLDLNNDGTPDFQFYASEQFRTILYSFASGYSYNNNISVNGLHKDSVNRIGLYSGQIPTSVPNSSWAGGAALARDTVARIQTFIYSFTSQFATSSGNFFYVTNKYLPLKFKNNGNTYYGWARLTSIAADQLIIADYAYNTTPNSPIAAGNTGCSFAPITPVVTVKNDTLESTSANKYQWYFDGAPVPGDTLADVTHSQQGYYAVLTTDANGCLSESQATYFSCYSVKPVISENSGFSNPSCGPAELQAVNLVSGTYIQWLRNGDTITTATAPAYLADSSGSYSAEFIDSGKTCYLISDTVQLTVAAQIPQPVVSTANHNTVLCPGGVLDISLTDSTDYTAADTLQWYFNGTLITGANKTIYSIDTSGTYFLSITDACIKYSDTTTITEDIEHPTISLGGTDTLITQPYTSYHWYEDSVQTADTGQYYIANTNGTYFVIITDSLGCSFKSPDYFYTSTGISSVIQPENVSMYSYDRILHVLFTGENLIGSPLRIYNTLGQEVYSTTLATGQTEIDMSNLVAGLYIVEVTGKTSSVIKKIVIE